MIEISKLAFEALRDADGNVSRKPLEWWRRNKLACIWCLLCMIIQIPFTWLKCIVMIICFIPHAIYEKLENLDF